MNALLRRTRSTWLGCAAVLLLSATAGCAPTYLPTSQWEVMRRHPLPIRWRIVSTLPHSTNSYTEGLAFVNGRLFESVGLYGKSALVELDPKTGQTLARSSVPDLLAGAADRMYAEGIAANGDQLLQLSWKAQVALVWNLRTMKIEQTLTYQGEGWGLCFDGVSFVRSDGKARLWVHRAKDFANTRQIPVMLAGAPLDQLTDLSARL